LQTTCFFYVKSRIEKHSLPNLLLFIGALASALWAIYFAVVTISIPYQIEFREGTAQVLTKLLLGGENPFVLDNQPLGMNNYGLGYNIVIWPFAVLFGNTLSVHRSVTFIFILLSSLISFLVVYRVKRESAPALACAAFVMIGLIGRGGVGAFPSAMGTFLFLSAVFIPILKSFDHPSLIFSGLFSIAAFYTKPYFVLACGVVASYVFLFVSKKKGVFYSILFLVLFVISFFVVRFVFPLYFINTIVGNISNTYRTFDHLFSQLKQLIFYFFPVLIVPFVALRTAFGKRVSNTSFNEKIKNVFNLLNWNQPFIGISANYSFYFFVIALLAFIFILGPHIGTYLNYAYQILIPAYFCWLFQKVDLKEKTGYIIVLLVLFNLFSWEKDLLTPVMLEQKTSKEWAELFSYLESPSHILNSPVVTSKIVELGKAPIDSGQTAYFYSVKRFPDNELIGPSYDSFAQDGIKYVRFIDNSIEKQKFDLILVTKEKVGFYHTKLIDSYYSPAAQITVDMPQTDQRWTIFIWRPRIR
jgi:hypothetical protein